MNKEKEAFIDLAIRNKVLAFGEFTLKSGRVSPYFFNAGLFYHGTALKHLGQFYAAVLMKEAIDVQHLFGPAYKGLPLATTTAVALAELGKDVTVTFNRKEAKNHGEGGQLIGAPLTGNTIIIDDVITAGTAFREAQHLIKDNGGTLTGVVIALDRCEKGQSDRSTVCEIKEQGINVFPIITLHDLIDYLEVHGHHDEVNRVKEYQSLYGTDSSLMKSV